MYRLFGNAIDMPAGRRAGYVTGFVKWVVVGAFGGHPWLIMPRHELSLY